MSRHRRLVSRTFLVATLTLVSRVLGFAREVVSAALFGHRSAVYDAFITAWRVPNLFRRFLGEGALATSFQTALTKVEGSQGTEAGRALFFRTLFALACILVGLCAVVMTAVARMPDTMPLTGWAWLGADPEPVRDLTVRLMPFVVLACVSALVGGALNVRGCFGAPAWAPAVMNVVWIGTLVWIGWHFGWRSGELADEDVRHLAMTHVLALGVLVSGVAQLVVQVPALRRTGILARRHGPRRAPSMGAADVLRRAAPLALGAAVYQINVMVDGLMAEGLLADGGPTLHYLANRVQQFPMALIAVAATSAVFPALQALGHAGDRAGVCRLHDRTQRAICFVALPASMALFVLARPIVEASFARGAFGAEGVQRAAAGLRMLALAILPAGAVGLVARTFYALDDFRTPVRVSSAMLVANVGLNLLFIEGFGMDVDGLALATTLSSWGTLALLLPALRKLDLPAHEPGLARAVGRAACAGAVATAAAAGAVAWLEPRVGSVRAVASAMAVGVVGYLGLAASLRFPELAILRQRLGARRASRTKP